MTRQERRHRTEVKLKQREKIMKLYGLNQGTCYEHQRNKIETNGVGYMRDGNLTHYTGNKYGQKTRMLSYRPSVMYKHSDQQRFDKLNYTEE